jgi:hypothetical protein
MDMQTAEQVPETPAPIGATDQIRLMLEAQQWNVVMTGLQELPYRVSAPVIAALSQQFEALARRGKAEGNDV